MNIEDYIAQLEENTDKPSDFQEQEEVGEEEEDDDDELPDLETETEDILPTIYSFHQLYETTCERIRSGGALDSIMNEFENLSSDFQRINYVNNLDEVSRLEISESRNGKDEITSSNHEFSYDALITEESRARSALQEIQESLKLTISEDRNSLARRFMKRGWASLILEDFEAANTDATRSLLLNDSLSSAWNSYEILAHYYAKKEQFKRAEGYFKQALGGLRESDSSQKQKAIAAARIALVYKNIKGKKDVKRKKSKKDQKNASSSRKQIPKVSYGRHESLTSASDAISVSSDELRGRYLSAARNIEPGDILIVEESFAASLSPDCFDDHCSSCFRKLPITSVPCLQCSTVWFCDEKCRTDDRSLFHTTECPILNILDDKALSKMASLVLRILVKETWSRLKENKEKYLELLSQDSFVGETNVESDYNSQSYDVVFNLVTNESKRSFGDLFQRSLMGIYLSQVLKKIRFYTDDEDHLFVSSLILRHLQGASCNAYGIEEFSLESQESSEIGGAIYPTVSLSNHSCWPNVVRYNVNQSCILRATRSIVKGSEIFDNYGPNYLSCSLEQRQNLLKVQYKFDCDCRACVNDWSRYPHGDEVLTFLCPELKCRQPATLLKNNKHQCNICGESKKFEILIKEMNLKVSQFNNNLRLIHNDCEKASKGFLEQQKFLDYNCVPPGKLYSDCQEAIKRSYGLIGSLC